MLALKEFRLDEKGDEFLYISGKSGKVLTELRCNSKNLLLKTADSLRGQLEVIVPNFAVSAIKVGFQKPLWMLVAGILSLILALIVLVAGLSERDGTAFFVLSGFAVLVGIVFINTYLKTKYMLFSVSNSCSNSIIAITVGKSSINGVKIGFELYQQAATLLTKAVLESRNPSPKS